VDSGGPEELAVDWGSRSPMLRDSFEQGSKTWANTIPKKTSEFFGGKPVFKNPTKNLCQT